MSDETVSEKRSTETTDRPTGRELRLVNAAIDVVNLFEYGVDITSSDSAKWKLLELREAAAAYVGEAMQQIPLRIVSVRE